MDSRFTRFWARVLVVVGMVLAGLGVLLGAVALVIDMPWGSLTGKALVERALVAIFLVVSGVLAGAPFIVLGEIVLVFLDQRRLLRRIARRLARGDAAIPRAPAVAPDQVRAVRRPGAGPTA